MIGPKLTTPLVALGLLVLPATPSMAFCHWFGRCAKPAPTTTFYAPVVAAPVVQQPTVVNYVPQTAYRSVVVNRPVVTMVPQAACGPCGQTTVMRPVTTMVAQQQLVPYTTCRPVVMASPVTVGYAPVAAPIASVAPAPMLSAPMAAPASPCCGSGNATPQPSLSGYAPQPMAPLAGTYAADSALATPLSPTPYPAGSVNPSGAPGTTLNSLTPTPSPSLSSAAPVAPATPAAPAYTPPASQPPQTFAPNGNGQYGNGSQGTEQHSTPNGGLYSPPSNEPQSRMLLPPAGSNTPSNSTGTRLQGPDPETNGDRITAIPLRSNYSVRQASLVVPAAHGEKPQSDDGWRPAAE